LQKNNCIINIADALVHKLIETGLLSNHNFRFYCFEAKFKERVVASPVSTATATATATEKVGDRIFVLLK